MALAYRKNHQGKIKERDSAVIKKAEKIDLPGWANSNERFYIMYVIQNRTVRLPCNWEVPSARGESVWAMVAMSAVIEKEVVWRSWLGPSNGKQAKMRLLSIQKEKRRE